MKAKTKIDLLMKPIMILVFLGIFSTSILAFDLPNSPNLIFFALISVCIAYFIMKFALIQLIKIFCKMIEDELIETLKASGEDQSLLKRIASAQAEMRKSLPTIH